MGVLAAFLSALFSGSKDLVSKKLAYQLDGMASTFASFAFALPYYVVLLAVLYLLGKETLTVTLAFATLVVLRASTDVFAEGMKMHALAHGDISVVASFAALSPLFLLVLQPLITGDRPSWTGVLAVLVVVCGGLLLVYRPGTTGWGASRTGVFLAIGASVFFALNNCFDRLAVKPDVGTPVMAGFSMTLVSALFLLPFGFRPRARREAMREQWPRLAVRGFLEVAFMVAKLSALQYLQPSYVMCIQRVSVLLSILGGRLFFKEQDFGRRMAAGTLVLAGVFWIAWMEATNGPPPAQHSVPGSASDRTDPLD
jgi:drug/metabolite transporter (DMT)-like permease